MGDVPRPFQMLGTLILGVDRQRVPCHQVEGFAVVGGGRFFDGRQERPHLVFFTDAGQQNVRDLFPRSASGTRILVSVRATAVKPKNLWES